MIEPGDRVLLRNVGLKGKNNLADRWSKDIFIAQSQPNPDVPVFVVKKEHGRGCKTVHRNLLLPFMGLPLNAPKHISVVHTIDLPTDPSNCVSDPVVSASPCDARHSKTVTSSSSCPITHVPTGKYVIPQRRKSTLNPIAKPFSPKRPVRDKRQPRWLTSGVWTK